MKNSIKNIGTINLLGFAVVTSFILPLLILVNCEGIEHSKHYLVMDYRGRLNKIIDYFWLTDNMHLKNIQSTINTNNTTNYLGRYICFGPNLNKLLVDTCYIKTQHNTSVILS